jgi:hypothetical protein
MKATGDVDLTSQAEEDTGGAFAPTRAGAGGKEGRDRETEQEWVRGGR